MKFRCLCFFLVSAFLTSCVVEKRHYRSGYYVNWQNHDEGRVRVDTTVLPVVESADEGPDSVLVVSDEDISCGESVISTPSDAEGYTVVHESTKSPAGPDGDPKPEGKDKLNPLVTPMVGLAYSIPLSLIVMEVTGALATNPYFWVIGIPLLAALLFAIAMQVRKKYLTLKSLGAKDEQYRLSAHFHRFQIMLYIYFTAALMISFGFALTLSTSAILGWAGIILSGGGIVVGAGVGAVLLALFVFYLIRWRKDPTGYKPPRNPHPGKDG